MYINNRLTHDIHVSKNIRSPKSLNLYVLDANIKDYRRIRRITVLARFDSCV